MTSVFFTKSQYPSTNCSILLISVGWCWKLVIIDPRNAMSRDRHAQLTCVQNRDEQLMEFLYEDEIDKKHHHDDAIVGCWKRQGRPTKLMKLEEKRGLLAKISYKSFNAPALSNFQKSKDMKTLFCIFRTRAFFRKKCPKKETLGLSLQEFQSFTCCRFCKRRTNAGREKILQWMFY